MLITTVIIAIAIGLGLLWCKRANGADWGKPGWLNYLDGFVRLWSCRFHGLKYDEIPLPESGPALIVSNHVSGLDSLLIVAAARRPVRFLIAREQYEGLGLQWLFDRIKCIPVDYDRGFGLAFREAFRALEAGDVIVVYPQAGITPDFRKPRRGGVWLSRRANCPLYPIYIDGIAERSIGHVLRALFLRGKPKLTAYPPVSFEEDDEAMAFLEKLCAGELK
ncbi:MAG: lysophospholipid acyltransferase family protein [Pseudomonadota bacterium]